MSKGFPVFGIRFLSPEKPSLLDNSLMRKNLEEKIRFGPRWSGGTGCYCRAVSSVLTGCKLAITVDTGTNEKSFNSFRSFPSMPRKPK